MARRTAAQRWGQAQPGYGFSGPGQPSIGPPGGGTQSAPSPAPPPAAAAPAPAPTPPAANPLWAFDPHNPARIDPAGARGGAFLRAGGDPANPTGIPNFTDILNRLLGRGNPFSPDASAAGISSLSDALQQRSQYNLGKDLAGIRSQFGAAGMGSSSREALAEGAAAGDAATGVNAQLAPLAFQARSGDLDRTLSAMVQSGQLSVEQAQQFLAANNQQFNQSQTLLGQENADQQAADQNANSFMSWLIDTINQITQGHQATH